MLVCSKYSPSGYELRNTVFANGWQEYGERARKGSIPLTGKWNV